MRIQSSRRIRMQEASHSHNADSSMRIRIRNTELSECLTSLNDVLRPFDASVPAPFLVIFSSHLVYLTKRKTFHMLWLPMHSPPKPPPPPPTSKDHAHGIKYGHAFQQLPTGHRHKKRYSAPSPLKVKPAGTKAYTDLNQAHLPLPPSPTLDLSVYPVPPPPDCETSPLSSPPSSHLTRHSSFYEQ